MAKDQSDKGGSKPSKEPLVRKDSVERPFRDKGGMTHDHQIRERTEKSTTDWQKPPRPKDK